MSKEKMEQLYTDLYYPDSAKNPIIYKSRKHFKKNPYGNEEGKGKWAVRFFNGESVCDVGCAAGKFLVRLKKGKRYGVDIAKCPLLDENIKGTSIKFIKAPAWEIPLKDKSVDYITSFDVLEHIPPENISKTLKEFSRIAKRGFVFFISYAKRDNEYHPQVHLTIQPERWWIKQVLKYTFATKYRREPIRLRAWWKELLKPSKVHFLIFK